MGAGSAGYVAGDISLTSNELLYIYCGQSGNLCDEYSSTYMFNGGGYASKGNYNRCGSCGGGATDIRTVGGLWDNATSLNNRIMIAAGGGGGGGSYNYSSACAGGLTGYHGDSEGYDGSNNTHTVYRPGYGNGGTQTAGGAQPTRLWSNVGNGTAGLLGKGGIGGYSAISSGSHGGGSGGGGGLYGGSGSCGLSNGVFYGGGGSSYISGHSGCTAKTTTFTNTCMIDGAGYQWTSSRGSRVGVPTIDGSGTTNGYVGNGYARITYPRP